MVNWDYSIADAVQLMIPILCSFLSAAVVIIYLFLYRSFKYRIYYAGFLISLGAFFYVLCESLVTLSGWTFHLALGRLFHYLGQLSACYFLYSMMLFASALTKEEGRIARISRFMSRLGLGIALIISAAAILRPDLFISLQNPRLFGIESPGDFGRGVTGILYTVRDILLGLYILSLIVISIISLVLSRARFSILLIVAGTLLAAFSGMDDMSYFHFDRNFNLNNFRFSRLSVGLSAMNFLIMMAILKDYIHTQDTLSGTHRTLKSTHGRLISSELKYRRLAEGTEHAVFSLSREFRVQSFNKKARLYFNLNDENLNLPLPELLSRSGESHSLSRRIVEENLRQLSRDKGSVSFHSTLEDPRSGEPEELEFHIDYYEGEEGEAEYICRAVKMKDHRLSRSIRRESLELSIGNNIIAIDDVTTRLSSALRRYLDEGSVLMIKMGLQELIINAIEHGNLNLSFDEKTRVLDSKSYLDIIRERQNDPLYRDRVVKIFYELNEERAEYRICDEGDGFDYRETMKKVKSRVEQDFLPHGRGISMAKIVFNTMEYNNRGNEVLVVKKFTR